MYLTAGLPQLILLDPPRRPLAPLSPVCLDRQALTIDTSSGVAHRGLHGPHPAAPPLPSPQGAALRAAMAGGAGGPDDAGPVPRDHAFRHREFGGRGGFAP